MRRLLTLFCAAPLAALSACGGGVEIVEPTPSSEFRSTYPCELLTKAMARDLLGIHSLRRVGGQSFDGLEECGWARGRYKAIPGVRLTISPKPSMYGERTSVAATMRRLERAYEGRPHPGYRAIDDLGERAYLLSTGRISSEVVVEQDGRSFRLVLYLKTKPRSVKPPLAELEAKARDISARYVRPPG